MKSTSRPVWSQAFLIVALALVAWVSLSTRDAEAQTGKNAVYDSNNLCSPCQASPAFIDASVFIGKFQSPDFCSVVNYALVNVVQSTYSYGAVVDARGLNSNNVRMTCPSSQAGPWAGITNPPSSTILLPATTASAPIVIPSTWTLPSNTHLIGEGDNISSSTTISTTIQAGPSFSASTNTIEFGSSSVCPSGGCTGISVENLTLDGQGQSINGISNALSQDSSYVNHVRLYQILGTGLSVSGNASNSGPYSNITFDTGANFSAAGPCVNTNGLSGTRGIHNRA